MCAREADGDNKSARRPEVPIRQIIELGYRWHRAGTVTTKVLEAIRERHAGGIRTSVETGVGRTTLLLSHLSASHTAFAIDDDTSEESSLGRVRRSPLLKEDVVNFVLGPTQRTLPQHQFRQQLDFVLIDGPHGFPFPALEYYYLYPHVRPGGTLVVDDLQIRSIGDMAEVLRQDAMWTLDELVDNAAFYTRTSAPLFNPLADGWWEQGYNQMTLWRRIRKKLRGY